jgi:hypothetical protein
VPDRAGLDLMRGTESTRRLSDLIRGEPAALELLEEAETGGVEVHWGTGLCGLPGNGSRAHTQVGHMIDTQVDLAAC